MQAARHAAQSTDAAVGAATEAPTTAIRASPQAEGEGGRDPGRGCWPRGARRSPLLEGAIRRTWWQLASMARQVEAEVYLAFPQEPGAGAPSTWSPIRYAWTVLTEARPITNLFDGTTVRA